MVKATVKSGGRFEEIGAYARAKRVGPFVYVSGTTAIEPTGRLHAPNDCYAQSVYIFERIAEALTEVGASLEHVVRTRAYFTDMSQASGFIKAHGEIFAGIDPVTSGVEAGLTQAGMMVEIEVDAVIHDKNGAISFD